MKPLTCDRPKPMVPVANRPLLEHVLRHLIREGWREIVLALCYQPGKIEAYFGDGSRWGVRFHYLVEERPMGTAGSVKMAEGFYDGTVLVASGDALCDFDLRAALSFHKTHGASVTIILTRVETPLEYGVVLTDTDGRIVRFLEKPGWGEVFSDTVNAGFYLIEPEVFRLVPSGASMDFSRDLFPLLLAQGQGVYGFIAGGYWSDIGTLEQYRRSNLDILTGGVDLEMPARRIGPDVWAGREVTIDPAARIEGPALLGDFCRVERGARIGPYAILGDHSLVAEEASVKRSVLWRHVYVGRATEVRGAVLGDHVVVKNGSSIYEGAVVGEGCTLGSYAVIRPEVKLWPGKYVESGSTVRESMVWSGRRARGLFGAAGVTGIANLELTPEVAVKLGAAFAAQIGQGRQAAIACDGFPASRLLKRAATAGMLGAGLHVRDLGTATPALLRFVQGALGLAGGVHLGLSSKDPMEAVVQFLDHRGLPIGRQAERALEHAFYSEDFPRVEAGRIGEMAYAPGLAEKYLDGIRDAVDAGAIAAAGFTLVLGPLAGPAAILLPGLLARLGCRYRQVDWPQGIAPGPLRADVFHAVREEVREMLAATGAVLAVFTDNEVEELYLTDGRGQPVGQVQLATLLSLAELRERQGLSLPVPVTATQAIADLARAFHGQVIRTKTQKRFVLEEFASMSAGAGGLILPAFDGLMALAKLLDLLASDGRSLPEILAEMPAYQRVERAVACTWEAKGRLLRRLIEESRGQRLELTDGLSFQDDRGWALILPDGDEPFVRIYSEAGTMEEADALSRFFADRLAALQQEGTRP